MEHCCSEPEVPAHKAIVLRAEWCLNGPSQHRAVASECSPNISKLLGAVENTGTVFAHTMSKGAPKQDQLQNAAHMWGASFLFSRFSRNCDEKKHNFEMC